MAVTAEAALRPIILGFSTYPVAQPQHGGQRRVAAFRDYYRTLGIDYRVFCTYEPTAYDASKVGPGDVALIYGDGPKTPSWIGDLLCGDYSAQSPETYAYYKELVQRCEPAAVQVEQPFMWPLVDRLRRDGVLDGVRLIYSSHNWEGPMREMILERRGMSPAIRRGIASDIEDLERDLCRHADLLVTVSADDAAHYDGLIGEGTSVFIVPNGTDRRTAPPDHATMDCVKRFGGLSPLIFVGSAHPPNYHGFNALVLSEGLPFSPPIKFLAVCGGVCSGISQSEPFQRSFADNAARIEFFNPVSDEELAALQHVSRGTLLPIQYGGGSNLKTSEALVLGKWVVTTSQALRGFDGFENATGVLVADTARAFRDAIAHALSAAPPELDAAEWRRREALYWDRCFLDSGFSPLLGGSDGGSR